MSARLLPALAAAGLLAGGAPPTAAAAPSSWTTYGSDLARTGHTATDLAPKGLRLAWTRRVDGRITAQPLVVSNLAGPGSRTIIVVTSAGDVHAFAANGRLRWKASFGALQHQCMQLDQYGITGTSVVDVRRRSLYAADAYGFLHALDLTTGRERRGWPVRVLPWYLHDHAWGALTMVGDAVYVAAGAYCDALMEGKLIRVSLRTHDMRTWLAVPLDLGGGGGIWGWGGPSYSARRRSLFVVTGNAFPGGSNSGEAFRESAGYGEHLVELSTELEVRSASHPDDIVKAHDLDFTGSPVVFTRRGCGELVAGLNKNGRLYLWRASSVGAGPVSMIELHRAAPSRPLLTQAAYSPRLSSLFVVTNVSLTRVQVTAACRVRRAWSLALETRSLNGSPTIAGNTVWFATSGRAPALAGVDARTGKVVRRLRLGELTLIAPTIVDRALYTGSFFGRVYAFSAR